MTDQMDLLARRKRGASLCAFLCAAVVFSLSALHAHASESAALAVPDPARAPRIVLRGPVDAPIPFHGAINYDGAAKPYEKIIRVISPAQGEKAGVAGWFNQNDNMLRQVSARMYAQSLDIALGDMKTSGESSDPFRTVRYSEGGTERMERAQVVSQHCGQLVLRT